MTSSNLNKHKLFLIDAVGAFVSVVLLFVLYSFEVFFGMPKNVVMVLMSIAAALAAYSSTIYLTKPANRKLYLTIAASLNMGYCLFTIYQMWKHTDTLSLYAYLYFVSEIVIISLLSGYEFKTARTTTAA